jgi:Fic family protein
MPNIIDTPYEIDDSIVARVEGLSERVARLRQSGALTADVLGRLRKFFKIKNIYNSNAIEGNILDVGETRLVVEQGLTITGRPLKDQAEAKNLSEAIDFLEELARDTARPITSADIRQIHYLILKGIQDENAGKYRNVPVEIGGSQFKPPGPEAVAPQMEEFATWLASACVDSGTNRCENAILTASVAHTWFVTIHPFIDGNGRCARLLMNLVLMRSGYPIAIITKADRSRYYDSLEISQSSDLTAVVALVSECLEESLEEYEVAAKEQRENQEWARSIVSKFQNQEKIRATNQYEV